VNSTAVLGLWCGRVCLFCARRFVALSFDPRNQTLTPIFLFFFDTQKMNQSYLPAQRDHDQELSLSLSLFFFSFMDSLPERLWWRAFLIAPNGSLFFCRSHGTAAM
jgi:hypothetical protein